MLRKQLWLRVLRVVFWIMESWRFCPSSCGGWSWDHHCWHSRGSAEAFRSRFGSLAVQQLPGHQRRHAHAGRSFVAAAWLEIDPKNWDLFFSNFFRLRVGFRFPDKTVVYLGPATDGCLLSCPTLKSPPRQVGESTDSLSTFISLVLLAELKDQLAMEGPLTVFAPTNAALAALGQSTLEAESDWMYWVKMMSCDAWYARYDVSSVVYDLCNYYCMYDCIGALLQNVYDIIWPRIYDIMIYTVHICWSWSYSCVCDLKHFATSFQQHLARQTLQQLENRELLRRILTYHVLALAILPCILSKRGVLQDVHNIFEVIRNCPTSGDRWQNR